MPSSSRAPSARSWVGWLAAWVGRALLLAVAVVAIGDGAEPLLRRELDAMAFFLGLLALGVLVATFGTTEKAGMLLAAFGLWAALTWYGVTALVDPLTVVLDSIGGRRRIETQTGARVTGAFFLLVANAPVLLWLWWRRTDRRLRRQLADPAHHAHLVDLHERDEGARRRRLAAKRRRKRKRRA